MSRASNVEAKGHMAQLKRLASYLKGAPRCTLRSLRYTKQTAFVDSDWAGHPVTRRSTTGMLLLGGKHLLRHSSTVQAVIGLSSAESEYYALTKGAC
eukprot:450754-Amphidinium_carterae.1